MAQKEFFKWLSAEDRTRFRFLTVKGVVKEFVVQLELERAWAAQSDG